MQALQPVPLLGPLFRLSHPRPAAKVEAETRPRCHQGAFQSPINAIMYQWLMSALLHGFSLALSHTQATDCAHAPFR